MAAKVAKVLLAYEDIDRMVVAKIRQRYDENEEMKMLRKGILNSNDPEFTAYNAYVEEQRQWGQQRKDSLE